MSIQSKTGQYISVDDFIVTRPPLSSLNNKVVSRNSIEITKKVATGVFKFYTTQEGRRVKVETDKLIGEGAFKRVNPAILCVNARGKKNKKYKKVAFARLISLKKKYPIDKKSWALKRESLLADRECYILNKIREIYPNGCRGLMQLLDTCEWEKNGVVKRGFVFLLYNGKTLEDAWSISLIESYKVALDIAYGLKALHSHDIIHNDLKPSNICLQRCNETARIISAHIIDFGLATDVQEPLHDSPLGSDLICVSPELNDKMSFPYLGNIDSKSDIYSYGKLLKRLNFKDSSICNLIARAQSDVPSERPSLSKFINVLEVLSKRSILPKMDAPQFNLGSFP